MRRIAGLIALVGLMGIAVTSVSWRANAQGDDSDLRTQVADLQTRVAALETRAAGEVTDATQVAGSHTINGDLTLRQEGMNLLGQCTGFSGYEDIHQGAQVTVTNERGEIIAVGDLGPGVPHNDMGTPMTEDDDLTSAMCVFPVIVHNVPDSDFYSIEVSHRGQLTYTREEIEAVGWEVHFSLG